MSRSNSLFRRSRRIVVALIATLALAAPTSAQAAPAAPARPAATDNPAGAVVGVFKHRVHYRSSWT